MDPQPNIAAAAVVPPSSKKRNGRSRVSNDPALLQPASLFAQARRRRDLLETFTAALGGPAAVSAVAMVHLKKAVELLALAELERAGALGGSPQTEGKLTALVRLEGEARRTLRLVGLKVEAPSRTAARVAERREARWAEQDRQRAAQAAARREASATHTTEPPDGRAA
jgi:hypothetical protein